MKTRPDQMCPRTRGDASDNPVAQGLNGAVVAFVTQNQPPHQPHRRRHSHQPQVPPIACTSTNGSLGSPRGCHTVSHRSPCTVWWGLWTCGCTGHTRFQQPSPQHLPQWAHSHQWAQMRRLTRLSLVVAVAAEVAVAPAVHLVWASHLRNRRLQSQAQTSCQATRQPRAPRFPVVEHHPPQMPLLHCLPSLPPTKPQGGAWCEWYANMRQSQ